MDMRYRMRDYPVSRIRYLETYLHRTYPMPIDKNTYLRLSAELSAKNITLVAVSKTQTIDAIKELYDLGQRDFGENYVQELTDKQPRLPADIRWHFIGHLQSNKVKSLAPFVHLVHGVDSWNLLQEINKQGKKLHRPIPCLLQVHIAEEETKFGLNEKELEEIRQKAAASNLSHVPIIGLMGMASFSSNTHQVETEFQRLHNLFHKYNEWFIANSPLPVLSMGMSADYSIAIGQGTTMVRIGSLLFRSRG